MDTYFRPPIIESAIVSRYETEDEGIQRLTAFLRDTNRRLFALTVATSTEYLDSLRDDKDDPTFEEPEPTFVVAQNTITPELVDELLQQPSLIENYLIPQDIGADLGP